MKILVLDIETAPNLAYVWGLWDQNISIDKIVSSTYMLCWTAKFLDDTKVHVGIKKKGLKKLWKLLDDADAVIHYNGKKFDIPHINREFLEEGWSPPSPYKQIDLLDTVRRMFKFPSNKLDYVAQTLGLKGKAETGGFATWLGCIKNDKEAWDKMIHYNIQDVALTEELYYKLRGWVPHHANHSIYGNNTGMVCPNCGGTHIQKRGTYRAQTSTYQRYRCMDEKCGKWFRDSKILNRKQHKTVGI
jgi:DNA polymerase elongation subunit (family B)